MKVVKSPLALLLVGYMAIFAPKHITGAISVGTLKAKRKKPFE